MPENYSWEMLNGNILFKRQNYINSCFAAAYQNLGANLKTDGRHQFSVTNDSIEKSEYKYMLIKHNCNIDNTPPYTINVNAFIRDYLDPLGLSINTILNDSNITVDILYRFGQTPNYRTGYILNYGNTNNHHACAFFIEKINEEDHYIFLDTTGKIVG